ncbi:TetR/AcrR family transcriptional regulator [Candidatus Solirubrobacter pratensis]|jgi:AcrR family transcriptional regulator|uniref:TetR/AcrR family transcriptional regulator n=1 Tax=Candidatus Solirubrobacter pratensis TaxID=1298857 RepID=UPI0004845671|nr:TetR/AcrR family transcriptional regulator [Candidatus Solirubrobacter pratensis]
MVSVSTTPVRGRPRDPQRRRAILGAAMALIAELGYDRTTIDAIAHRAGVSKPTLYRRWPHGKPELVADALRERRAGASPDTGSLRGDLLALVAIQTSHLHEDVHLACGLLTQLRTSPELAAVMHEHVIAEERARFTTVVERAAARGELEAGEVSPLFADLAGAVVFTRVTITAEPVDEAFAEELVDHVLLPILNIHPKRN